MSGTQPLLPLTVSSSPPSPMASAGKGWRDTSAGNRRFSTSSVKGWPYTSVGSPAGLVVRVGLILVLEAGGTAHLLLRGGHLLVLEAVSLAQLVVMSGRVLVLEVGGSAHIVVRGRLGKKQFFVNSEIWEYRFGGKNAYITTNVKSRQNSVNQIFNPYACLFFLLTGATCYYHDIYIVFKYFASFTGYTDNIFEVISNLHVQGSKFGGKFDKLCGKSLKKIELHGVLGVRFFQVW